MHVSVIMSVYNESYSEIKKSIDSIMNQTYRDLDLIVVVDNSQNRLLLESLEKVISETDSKNIHVILNEENIGLAMSMNKAFEYAMKNFSSKYIARMDADDYSHPDRIEEEVVKFQSGNYDIVYTNCYFVDSEGMDISDQIEFIEESKIIRILPYRSAIVHPSVMFTSNFFKEVGYYRNFPSAQDYDLWLRSVAAGAKFGSVSKKLLTYTVRDNSISRSNLAKQEATAIYIKKLYNERLKKGHDSFSIENYLSEMEKYRVFDKNYLEKYQKSKLIQEKSMESIKNKKFLISSGYNFISTTLTNKILRKKFVSGIRYRIIMKEDI